MTKEKLMEWGLTEEQANKVMEGLNGSFVTKARFNEVNEENKALKAQVSERDGQIETLKKSAGDNTELQNQITALQEANKQKDKDHAKEISALRIANAVDMALSTAKAKNNTAVKALLAGFLEKAELAEDGTVKGLDDEIGKLVKGSDTAFLFDVTAGTRFKGARAAEKGDPGAGGDMTLDKLRKLPPAERYKFSINHPEEYRELYNGRNET